MATYNIGKDKAIFHWDVLSTKVTRRIWGHDARVNSLAYDTV